MEALRIFNYPYQAIEETVVRLFVKCHATKGKMVCICANYLRVMGRKSIAIELTSADRKYLELQTRARTIQAQTVIRARILLLKADGHSIDDIADKVEN